MSAIGGCRILRTIDLTSGLYSVRDEEATALLYGLQRNPALQRLKLCWLEGFGTPEACIALAAAVARPGSELLHLDLRGVRLSVEGLGHISAALRDNTASRLSELFLDVNEIGNVAGARHVATILSHSRALGTLGICGIGMDDVGSAVIADAVARTTTLWRLDIGYDPETNPEQAAMLIPVLTALTGGAGLSSNSESKSARVAAQFNRSIAQLWISAYGLPGDMLKGSASAVEGAGLAEAVAAMLRCNTTLKVLRVSSFFVTRGLVALPNNSSITELQVVHGRSLDAEELDPLLMEILHKCTKLEVLHLTFGKTYGPSKFTKDLFQGLKHNNLCIKRLVLDGWIGLDDLMFEDLIQSLSTNTNLEHISIKGSSWDKPGRAEHLAETLRNRRAEPQLRALLTELEFESPSLQQLPSVDVWGSYFRCNCEDRKCGHRDQWQWDVRLRLMTAIGSCRTLRKVVLNPRQTVGAFSVRQVEALALLSGLQDNLVLQELRLFGYRGFGTAAACLQALAAVMVRTYRSLDLLSVQYVGLTAEGLGYIAAALRRNGSSVPTTFCVCGNDIGNAVGAQHLADILTNSPKLRYLWMGSIGMDEEGAVRIAEALAHTTTLNGLLIGDYWARNPNAPAPMFIIPLLQALVWHTPDEENPAEAAASNGSIKDLKIYCPGGQQAVEVGLGEALARVIRSNRALNTLTVSSFFITRGLEALPESSSITELTVHHTRYSDDEDMDPKLITILHECKSVEQLTLQFQKPFGSSSFTKVFFPGLYNNRSIKTLVLDDWDGLDDYMFQNLMRSLRPNCENVVEKISIKNTSWEREGKGIPMQKALTRNISTRSCGRQGSEEVPPGSTVPVFEDPELLALLAGLESPSPTLTRLPRVEAFGQLFNMGVEHPMTELGLRFRAVMTASGMFKKGVEHAKADLRLRLMTAIGRCPTLTSIQLDDLGGGTYSVTVAEAMALLKGLSSNARVVEGLNFNGCHSFGEGAVCKALAAVLQSSCILHYLNMGYTGMSADGLGSIAAALRQNRNTVLRSFHLSGNTTAGGGVGAQHLADMLTTTPSLRNLGIYNIGVDEAGAVMIGDALAQNTTLDFLRLGFGRVQARKQAEISMATLLARAFTPGMRDAEQEAQSVAPNPTSVNKSVTHLKLDGSGPVEQPVTAALGEAVARMLRSSTTLKHLELCSWFISQGLEGLCDNSSIIRLTVQDDFSSAIDDYCKLMPILHRCQTVEHLHLVQDRSGSGNLSVTFFKALQTTRYLKSLVLDGCLGLNDDMFHELMQSLQVNTNLESVSFKNTVWDRQGKGAVVDEVLRQNREYRKALAGVPTMPVKSCRLVLCGFPYAGKTTIRKMLMEMETHENYTEAEGDMVAEHIPRTLGFEVNVIKDVPTLRVPVWDLAGHVEYHALHNFIFPRVNNSALFLFVYNPFKFCSELSTVEIKKDRLHFRDEFIYWLKFIASNSQVGQAVKPCVHVVVTFGDKIKDDRFSIPICAEMVAIKKTFMDLVEIVDEQTFINGRSWKDVQALRTSLEQKLQQLIGKLPPIPNICDQTRIHVQRWAEDQQGMPIISLDKFRELFHYTCKVALEHPFISKDYEAFLIDFMKKEDSWKGVASYLMDSGEIIYFEMSRLMIINLQWLGMGVFAQMINIFGKSDDGRNWLEVQNGFLSKYELSKLLKMSLNKVGLVESIVSVEQFIQLLLELHLCFESKDEDDHVRYFIPICTYGEGDIVGVNGQLEWPPYGGNPNDCVFMGLRLQCHNQDCTFLTPGFFPRLQVFFYTYCLRRGWIDEDRPMDSGIKLQPNVLLICAQFLDIFIEFNVEIGCYVDVLVRSTGGYLESLSFVQEHIVSQIRSFCASYEGCAGVTLVEGVLRRECVVSLTLCRYRKHESILTDKLVQEVAAAKERRPAYYTHSWRAILNSTQGQPPILKANREYATMVDGHVILGQKEDLVKAEKESQGLESSSSMSGETPVQLSPDVKAVQEAQHIAWSYPNHSVEAGKRRGLAVIVSMEEGRSAGEVDRGRLEALFKNLAFHTDIVANQSENIKTYLREVANDPNLVDDDCFLCCINAHGGIEEDGRQYIFQKGASGEKLYVDDAVLKPITESSFLADKAKVFLINACRGSGSLMKTRIAEDSEVESSQNVSKSAGEVRLLRSVKDCLVFFSTSHGQESFRDTEKGTHFITALMNAIVEGCRRRDDVHSILTSVIAAVTEIEVKVPSKAGERPLKKFQCPELYSTLTGKLYWS